jgi:hypothetical protein
MGACCLRMELKGLPSIQNYKEVSAIAQFRFAGLPTQNADNVCIDGERLSLLQEFNSNSEGTNKWYPLGPWGSEIYFENSCSEQNADLSFLSENLDDQTITDGDMLMNTTGMIDCNPEGSQFGNSFCQEQYDDSDACCMSVQVKNVPDEPTYGEAAMLWKFTQAGFPIDEAKNVCVPSNRLTILDDFNSRSADANNWNPLELWGSEMYVENQCAIDFV